MTLTLTPHTPTVPPTYTIDADGYEVPVYDEGEPHIGRVPRNSSRGSDTPTEYKEIGGVSRPVLKGGLHIPISAPRPIAGEQRGMATEYVVTAIGTIDDPALLGMRYLVVGSPVVTATARRLDVVEVD